MDLVAAIAMVRRRWLVIVLCLVAGIGGGFDIGHHGAKQYRSTAQCLVSLPPSGNVSEQVAGSQLASSLVTTYATLVSSSVVGDRANQILASQGVTSGAGGLSATVVNNTYLVNISAVAASPDLAALTANAGAKALVKTVADLESGIPQPITVRVTSPAGVPGAAFSPRPKLDLLVGIVLGLVAGLGIATLMETLDRTIKSTQEGDAALGVPLVGLIPRRRGGGLVVDAARQGPDGEPYRTLRTALRFLEPDRPLRVILMTSPVQGDGKTVTAANLAAALALSGDRVIAVDADLRHAGLSEAFGLDRSVGLTSLVLGTAELDDVLQPRTPNLSVLATGPLPPNPSEILGSQLVHNLLAEVAARADVVIIDAPPILPVADALALAPQVDGVVLVVRHSHTLRHAAAESARRLESIGANFIGYVLNSVPRGESRGIYADARYGVATDRAAADRGSSRAGDRTGIRRSQRPNRGVSVLPGPERSGRVDNVLPDSSAPSGARRSGRPGS